MMNKKSFKYIDFSDQYDKFKLMNMSMMIIERVEKGINFCFIFYITENNVVFVVNGVYLLLR